MNTTIKSVKSLKPQNFKISLDQVKLVSESTEKKVAIVSKRFG